MWPINGVYGTIDSSSAWHNAEVYFFEDVMGVKMSISFLDFLLYPGHYFPCDGPQGFLTRPLSL